MFHKTSLEKIINDINLAQSDNGTDKTSEVIAAEFAYSAVVNSGFDIESEILGIYLENLIENGAIFDMRKALNKSLILNAIN